MNFSGAVRRAFAYRGNVEQLTHLSELHAPKLLRKHFENYLLRYGQNYAYNGWVLGMRIMEISVTHFESINNPL